MHSQSIQKLITLFSKFPTVGPRTASRFVFYLLKMPRDEVTELLVAISQLREKTKICTSCQKPFEPAAKNSELCEICSDPRRDKKLICVVENETDLESLEKTKKYHGFYFVLGGTVSNLKKESLEKIKAKELQKIIEKRSEIKEIILAINSTSEGEATALYLERLLKPYTCGEMGQIKKITRLGRGLPLGSELEYADEETLSSALEGRK